MFIRDVPYYFNCIVFIIVIIFTKITKNRKYDFQKKTNLSNITIKKMTKISSTEHHLNRRNSNSNITEIKFHNNKKIKKRNNKYYSFRLLDQISIANIKTKLF